MKKLNYFLIGFTALGIFILSSLFFIGSEENIAELKSNYFSALIGRTLFFAIPSIMLFGLLFLINKKKEKPLRIGLTGIIICLISSLIGTLIFLN